jgi:xanthine dehydrogenase accessory factor
MKRAILNALNDARHADRAIVRATDLETGEDRLVDPYADGSALGLAARQAARADRSGPVEIENKTWFLAVYNPPLDLAIIGAVHIAQPLARMAALTGYGVRVIDPRTSFATTERFPGIALLVALTHDPKLDDPALVAALRSNCFYIGALGSKKTHAGRLSRLKTQGFSDVELERIHGPVGLSIGARSPSEIAISILAEMTLRLRTGGKHSVARALA